MSKISIAYKQDAASGPIPANVHFSNESAAPCPIVLIFHAGGFAAGSIEMVPIAEINALVKLGFVVVVPAYRLSPSVSVLDGAMADADDCLTWTRNELPSILEKEGVKADGRKVVAMGHSAGGGMALWLGSRPDPPAAILSLYAFQALRDPFWEKGLEKFASMPDIPQALLDRACEGPAPVASEPMFVNGKPNLESPRAAWMINALKTGTLVESIMKGPNREVKEEDWAETEPSRGFSGEGVGRDFPPTCFIHGDADEFVPIEFSEKAHEKLSAMSVPTEFLKLAGANHVFDLMIGEDDPVFKDFIMKGLNFLKRYV